MARILTREAAKRDLADHFVWYGENAGIDVAERFLAAAQDSLEHLAAFPACGATVEVEPPELAGIRRAPIRGFEKILVFYFPLADGVDLVRVIHGSRDLDRLFDEGFLS